MTIEYPRIEIEQEEFHVYVIRYESFFQHETIAAFPYGYDSDDTKLDDAIKSAKEFKNAILDSLKVNP